MRAFFTNKLWIVALAFVSLAALTALATGMRGLSFHEATPFGREEMNVARSVTLETVRAIVSIPFPTQLAIWSMFILLVALIGLLLSPEARKRLIRILFRLAFTYWALYILFTRYPEVLAGIGLSLTALNAGANTAANGAPVPEFTPPPAASWTAYLFTFGIILILLILALRSYLSWKESKAQPGAEKDRIAKIARASIKDLSSGRESTDVILNCYYRMSDAVSQRKHLDRGASITPSEFASRLREAGLPSDAVESLTRLFESVRYGGRRSDPAMVREAVTCLTSILQFCGETV